MLNKHDKQFLDFIKNHTITSTTKQAHQAIQVGEREL